MADQKALDDLHQRIALLRWDDQLHLFELVLGDYRRSRATDDSAARQELAAREAWHLQQQQSSDRATKDEA